MSALSALLARDRVVPPQKIDEAIQRQVINGGDFETNLLEIGALEEDVLVGYCAALYEAEAVGRDELMRADLTAIERIRRDLAEGFRTLPIRLEEGRLIIAAAQPLPEETRVALEAVAGMAIEVRITTPFRLSWGLWRFYGSELSPRLQRLASRLDKLPSGAMAAVVRNSSMPPRPKSAAPPAIGGPSGKLRSALAALSAALTEERDSAVSDAPVSATVALGSAASAPVASRSTITDEVIDVHIPTVENGREEVARAKSRDEIIDALLDFAVTRVSYAVVFAVRGDVAEGLDARGDGLEADLVRRIAVPLDAPGAFRSIRERGEPVIGPLGYSGADPVIKSDLARDAAVAVALLPIHIGGRVALIVWGDAGDSALDLAGIEEIVSLCGEAATSFERLIQSRKSKRPPPSRSLDSSRVTTGDISRKVVEQRGVQALRSLAAAVGQAANRPSQPTVETPRSAPPPAPDGGSTAESDETATPRESARPVIARPEPRPTPPRGGATIPRENTSRDTIETEQPVRPAEPASDNGTRHARGGRVPIAVDIIGPLPNQGPPEGRMRTVSRSYDPRREPDELAQPLVHDDSEQIVAEIVRTGSLTDAVANALIGAGDRALTAVFRRFPGPTHIDRTDTSARLPPVPEVGPLMRLVVMFRQASLSHLLDELESHEAERRYFATLCLSEVVQASALPHLLPRLFDADIPTRHVAVEAVRAYRRFPEFDQFVRALRTLSSDTAASLERRRVAANVLGELRDVEAVPSLLVALSDRDPALVGVSRRSLVLLARQDFGDDIGAWREWWERAAGRHRIEWLIDGLLHTEASIRHDASEELKKLTGQFFGYYFNLPRREREKAHHRYMEWWQREGRTRFAR